MSSLNLPVVDFYMLDDNNNLVAKTTKDIFLGKRTVMIMVPGAFTPTCSEHQLPEFESVHDQILSFGCDQVVCTSVNDAYVMKAWAEKLGITKTIMLPDGNGFFAQGLKALVSKENKGMGGRFWRCAVIINAEGKVEWGAVEDGQRQNASDDPYEETTPERVIGGLLTLQASSNPSEAELEFAQSQFKGFSK